MKAKITRKDGYIRFELKDNYGRYYSDTIEDISDENDSVVLVPAKSDDGIDWEERRFIVAKDMLAAIESNSNPQMFIGDASEQVKWAIGFADELIKQLKEKKE